MVIAVAFLLVFLWTSTITLLLARFARRVARAERSLMIIRAAVRTAWTGIELQLNPTGVHRAILVLSGSCSSCVSISHRLSEVAAAAPSVQLEVLVRSSDEPRLALDNGTGYQVRVDREEFDRLSSIGTPSLVCTTPAGIVVFAAPIQSLEGLLMQLRMFYGDLELL